MDPLPPAILRARRCGVGRSAAVACASWLPEELSTHHDRRRLAYEVDCTTIESAIYREGEHVATAAWTCRDRGVRPTYVGSSLCLVRQDQIGRASCRARV